MSEKLRFADNTEFDLAPNGITKDTACKKKYLKFISNLNYAEVEAIVSNSSNFATIKVIGSDGEIQNTYVDCVSYKGLGIEKDVVISDTVTADVYTVTYSVDAVEKKVNALETQITEANQTIDDLNIQCDDLSNTMVMISMM